MRLAVFVWVVVALGLATVASISEGLWYSLLAMLLFGGAIAGLMLDLEKRQVYVLFGVGMVGVLL